MNNSRNAFKSFILPDYFSRTQQVWFNNSVNSLNIYIEKNLKIYWTLIFRLENKDKNHYEYLKYAVL